MEQKSNVDRKKYIKVKNDENDERKLQEDELNNKTD